jgi:transmembrane sensor
MPTPDADSDAALSVARDGAVAEQAAAWFSRLRSARLSLEERQAFEAWLRDSPAHTRAYTEVCGLWDDPSLKAAAAEAAGSFQGLQHDGAGTSPRWVRRFYVAAAVAALAITSGFQLDLPLRVTSDYRTATGERRVVELPDGSTTTLNTKSAIAIDFAGTTRQIRLLKGEALFQVHPNEERPFVVEDHDIITRAVGTEFLVRTGSNGVLVTVVEGVVEVAPSQRSWVPVRITAGQQVTVDSNGPGAPHDVDGQTALAWSRGRLVFDDARLADVVEELRRYHTGFILLWNPAVAELRVSGSYTGTDPAGVLATLAQTFPIRMARLTDHIVVLF